MRSDRVLFVAERFVALRSILEARGYALDPGARDPNQWEDLHREDPPLGIVRMKGVRLVNPQDEDSDFNPEVSFSIQEYWTTEPVTGAQRERGLWLASYSYHGHDRNADVRFEFDPEGHREVPYHFHPAPHERVPAEPISPEEALDEFEGWLSQRTRRGA